MSMPADWHSRRIWSAYTSVPTAEMSFTLTPRRERFSQTFLVTPPAEVFMWPGLESCMTIDFLDLPWMSTFAAPTPSTYALSFTM